MNSTHISNDTFGKTKDGTVVERYILHNSNKITVEILTIGGIIHRLYIPDRNGQVADIVTGYDDIKGYEDNPAYFGALVGRVANRIKAGKFSVDGKAYSIAVNNGTNALHGGIEGFNKKVWSASIDGDKLRLNCTSQDEEEGYPGTLDVTVTYQLTEDNELIINYTASTSKPTPINLTNHAYFNLAGHNHGNIYDQVITIPSERFTPKDDTGIPTGEIASVEGTVFDLRSEVAFGKDIHNVPGDLGFDHNYCVLGEGNRKLAARVSDPSSGRVLECFTSAPGVQLYTGNYLDMCGKNGAQYNKHAAFCLETQNYPDAINQPNFPNAVLRPGESYRHITSFKFTTC